ncbi:MAG TPA: flavin reductase family protein [Paucimonas sp.]|nr:flavin reductase family protein [Paucimonas sp.]
MHAASEPAILYFGTPVVIVGTVNEDGTFNLAPISSVFWLGWRCVIGVGAASQTARNLRRTRECVLNLPSENEVGAVNKLALTTGANPVPERKHARGYRHVKDKFGIAGLTPLASETVAAPRVLECPVQLEAAVEAVHGLAEDDEAQRGRLLMFETRIKRAHLEESILVPGQPNRIDPDKWRPLIMSFQKFYGLADRQLHDSRLSSIPEEWYRSIDVDRARREAARVAEPQETLS